MTELEPKVEDKKSTVAIDHEGNEDSKEASRKSLLDDLSNDVEMYHKKVQLKRKIEGNLSKEREIQASLIKESEEREQDKDDEDKEAKVIASEATKLAASIEKAGDEEDDTKTTKKTKRNSAAVETDVGVKPTSRKRRRRGLTIPWTKNEDDAIVYYKEEMRYSWKRIEELLNHRHSWQAIQMRYLRNHKSRNEEWSRYMEIKLINVIRKDWENRWKRISNELGKDFSVERCLNKNIEICKKMEIPYYASVFKNKEITAGYANPFHDIKDAEQHKKLMLVYMGLDSISYEDSDNESEGEESAKEDGKDEEAEKKDEE